MGESHCLKTLLDYRGAENPSRNEFKVVWWTEMPQFNKICSNSAAVKGKIWLDCAFVLRDSCL